MDPLDLRIADLARDLVWTTLLLAGPVLLVALVVGVLVSLFQALTSVQEQTVGVVFKLLAVLGAMLLLLVPALEILRGYAERVLADLVAFGLS